LLYLILFWQASRLDRQERAALIPVLLAASIPVCLWQLLLAAQGANRLLLGSSAGNPDFLSSCIVMVLLFCVPQLLAQIAAWPRPLTLRRRLAILCYAPPILLMAVSLIIAQGRGALFGLAVGVLFCLLAWAVIRGKRRLLLTIGVVVIVGVVAYAGIATLIRLPNSFLGQTRQAPLMRLFMPYDPARIMVWNAASGVVYLQSQPIFNISQQGDPLTLLRPLVGYGPETVDQLQSRFGDIFGANVSVNSFHNAIYDALTTQGWIGLLSGIALLETALCLGLQKMNMFIFERQSLWRFGLWQAAGAAAGIAILSLVTTGASPFVLAPIGAPIGAVGGILAWIGWKGWLGTGKELTSPAGPGNWDSAVILAILAVLLAQWADTQFGFATGSTQPLYWIFLGVLAGSLASPHPSSGSEAEDSLSLNPLPSGGGLWYACALIAGLFTLHSFGVLLQSRFLPLELGVAQLPILLGALFVWGLCGGLLHADWGSGGGAVLKNAAAWTVVFSLSWGAYYLAKMAILSVTGTWLDNAVQYSNQLTMPRDLVGATVLLAVPGLIAALGAVLTLRWIARERPITRDAYWRWRIAAIGVGCLVTCAFYSISYSSGVLHNMGNSYMQRPGSTQITGQTPTIEVGTAALEAASRLVPWNVPLRLHWTSALADGLSLNESPDVQNAARAQITALLNDIFRNQPYFVNTLEWRNFSRAFAELLR
ncbi:MAG TPA: hypothetical protein VKQ72_00940, partial [Aggregatilineales bacterium]|nr:hypothetical protein [Aggregatilineales bacterium]